MKNSLLASLYLLMCLFLNAPLARAQAPHGMGTTWVVLVENSNYQTFASLEGPAKDMELLRKALAAYDVKRVVHKKDLTLEQMKQFFGTELKTLVESNGVSSILIWYAGHGKLVNQTSYWIPVDAKRDNEMSYYNISSLKDAMLGYNNGLLHTLVVTDACESGPSFYQAMRSMKQGLTCDNPKASQLRSAQVLASSGYELASGSSHFTKAFAKSLELNANSCMPVEEIVSQVHTALKNQNQQRPQFGKIPGMDDKNGTFFFMKK